MSVELEVECFLLRMRPGLAFGTVPKLEALKHDYKGNFPKTHVHFTTSPEARRCPPEAIFRGKQDNLWASGDVIKRRPRYLKLGLHSDFGQTAFLSWSFFFDI